MNLFVKSSLCLLLSLLLFSHVSLASEEPLQQYFLKFPPFWDVDAAGNFTGSHYRLAKRLYQHAGLDVKFSLVPYKRMQLQVARGLVPFINYGEVADVVTEDILHVCVPPTKITLRVYYTGKTKPNVNTPDDFEGKNVVILRGLPLGEYEKIKSNPKINLIKPNSTEAALKILFIGRGDYLITFENNVDGEPNNPFSKNELKSYFLFTLLGYPVTTPKSYANGEAICAKVLSSYHQLVKEGIIDSNSKVLISEK